MGNDYNYTEGTFGQRHSRNSNSLEELIPILIEQEKSIMEFEVMVSKMHPGFWRRLLKMAPDLTPMEIRICGLTRLHMHAKEVAHVLNITRSSVEAHRSHARCKLQIDRRQNFMSALHAI
jgi:DNA-binding CsgD family transcriptional regulator